MKEHGQVMCIGYLDVHIYTYACSIPYNTVQTLSVHLGHCYQSCLQVQVLQRKLQRKLGPETTTHNTQTGHMIANK